MRRVGAWRARASAAAGALLLLACGGEAPPEAPASAEHWLVGEPAPAFSLPAQAGAGRVTLTPRLGKLSLVDFFATWCVPCEQAFYAYERLAERYGDRLEVLALSVDEDPQGLAAFRERTGVGFAVAWDEARRTAKRYGPPGIPTAYLVDGSGIVRGVHSGFVPSDEARLRAEIDQLLQ